MKRLIAVVTCDTPKFIERANAQRATWVPDAAGEFDVRFFLGRLERPAGEDEVILDVEEGYKNLPAKTKAVAAWALEHGYDYVFKTDDDTYVNLSQLAQSPVLPYDYVGRFRGPSDPQHPWDYASGFAYWLSRKAMKVVAEAALDADWAEDRWVSKVLQQAGIQGYTDDFSYAVAYPPLHPETIARSPLRYAAVLCEFPPAMLVKLHGVIQTKSSEVQHDRSYLRPIPISTWAPPKQERPILVLEPKPKADLSKVCVLIKTFLRDGYMIDAVSALEKRFPEVKIVIADDGRPHLRKAAVYARLRALGHTVLELPWDVGFGAKANAAIPHFDRPYVLIGSDDFLFDDPLVRAGVEKLAVVLDNVPDIAVASGRVNNLPYEGYLSYGENFIRETPLEGGDYQEVDGVQYKLCDLTVNFSLVRREVLGSGPRQVRWVEDFKIGGEHFWFFYHMKRADWKVAFVPGVNIGTMKYDPTKMDPDYDRFRQRAWDCVGKFVKMWCGGIPESFHYIGFDGESYDYVAVAKQRGLILPNGELKS